MPGTDLYRGLNVLDVARNQYRKRLDLVDAGIGAVEDPAVGVISQISDSPLAQLGKTIGETRGLSHGDRILNSTP